jgi:hypothetical protein
MLLAHLGHFQGETDMFLCHDRKLLEVFLAARTQIIGFSFPAATLSVYGKSAIYVKSCIGTLGASMIHCRRAKSLHCSASKTKQIL